jgi:hypothetical protein
MASIGTRVVRGSRSSLALRRALSRVCHFWGNRADYLDFAPSKERLGLAFR